MSKSVKMEIFKGGTQTDSAGNTREWTETDLDTIVANTNALKSDIPFTIGHKKTDGPAWAWGKKVFRKGKSIFTEMGDVTDELGIMLKKKMFKERSIALRPDLSIRHIALLGAEPPAIKGLEAFNWQESGIPAFEFGEADSDFDESAPLKFSENEFRDFETRHAFGNIARIFRKLRDKMIEKDGIEKTDAILPDFLIDAIKDAENRPEPAKPLFNEPKPEIPKMDIETLQAEITELEGNFAEQGEKIVSLESELKIANDGKIESENKFAEYKANERKGELNVWVEKMIDAGKVLKADGESTLTALIQIDGNEALDFSEGEKTVKKTTLDLFKESIENGESKIEFGESLKNGEPRNKSGDDKLATMASERAKKDGVAFNEGLRRVIAENPTINQNID